MVYRASDISLSPFLQLSINHYHTMNFFFFIGLFAISLCEAPMPTDPDFEKHDLYSPVDSFQYGAGCGNLDTSSKSIAEIKSDSQLRSEALQSDIEAYVLHQAILSSDNFGTNLLRYDEALLEMAEYGIRNPGNNDLADYARDWAHWWDASNAKNIYDTRLVVDRFAAYALARIQNRCRANASIIAFERELYAKFKAARKQADLLDSECTCAENAFLSGHPS